MITNREFRLVANMPEFKNYNVSQNKNGTIVIKVADRGTNYYNWNDENSRGISYQLGYNDDRDEYWIRRRNGGYISLMHHNRKTNEYGFKSFDEMLDYFLNFWHKKYGKVTETINENSDYDEEEFEIMEIIRSEVFNVLEDLTYRLKRKGIELTDERLEAAVEFYELHKDY